MAFKKDNAIRAILIFEVVGRPKDYIEKVMSTFLEKMGERKDIELINKNVLPATEMKDTKDLYSIVAETEFYFNNIEVLLGFMLDTMPASIEIVEPKEITLDLPKINAFINDYLTKLHQYDDIYKKLKLEREILIKRLTNLEGVFKKIRSRIEETQKKKEEQENKKN